MTKQKLSALVRRFAADESGAAAIEYAILASLIAGAIILAVTNLGTSLTALFQNIANNLTTS